MNRATLGYVGPAWRQTGVLWEVIGVPWPPPWASWPPPWANMMLRGGSVRQFGRVWGLSLKGFWIPWVMFWWFWRVLRGGWNLDGFVDPPGPPRGASIQGVVVEHLSLGPH